MLWVLAQHYMSLTRSVEKQSPSPRVQETLPRDWVSQTELCCSACLWGDYGDEGCCLVSLSFETGPPWSHTVWQE